MIFSSFLRQIKFNYILYLLLSISIAYLILISSNDEKSWFNFWKYFDIPSMWPPFYDLDHVRESWICKMKGIDPYLSNPCDFTNIRYQYPSSWLHIFQFFKLENDNNYFFFILITLSIYLFFNFCLIENAQKYFNKIVIILLIFSTTNTILIERGNVDYLIFIFVYLMIFSNKYLYNLFLIIFNSILKIYPFFLFFYLVKQKKLILFTFFSILVTIFILYDISLSKYIDKNHSIMALSQSYGVQSIIEGFFKTIEKKYYFFFSENNKNLIRLIGSLGFLIISIIFFYKGTKSSSLVPLNEVKNKFNLDTKEKLFTLGSCIYIGTYIFYGNVDYRLIFLFLTIPFMENLNQKINYVYSLSVVIISNSWFYSFVPLTTEHVIYTTFLYSIKMTIFLYLSYLLGKINKNFFKLKTNKF